jgi:hypothetical protein
MERSCTNSIYRFDDQTAAFGLPAEDDGSRDDALLCLNMPSCPARRHDFDALRAASTRIVVGVEAQSATMIVGRARVAVAATLRTAGQRGLTRHQSSTTGSPVALIKRRLPACMA